MVLYGEPGATKTTLARIIGLLIDARVRPTLAAPGTTRALMGAAANRWLLAYDNIRVIPDWLSDALCLLSTGGAVAGNAPLSGDGPVIWHAERPVILNGIEEFVGRSDLSDRSVLLHLPPINPRKRLCLELFWQSFHEDYPRILGALLDAVVGGLRELPSVRISELPRMADFATFAEAVGRSLGWPANTVLSDYDDNRREATLPYIQDSPVADCLLEMSSHKLDWTRSATDLLDELTVSVGKRTAASPRWPKSPLALSKELRRIAPQLRTNGVSVIFERNRAMRLITITNLGDHHENQADDIN